MSNFILNDSLSMALRKYVLKRICLPFFVNIVAYFIARIIIKSERFSNDVKNMTCSFALCTLAGSMAALYVSVERPGTYK